MSHTLGHTVNCSLLFTELPINERPQAARDAGFHAVEFWWPWDTATPPQAEIDDFITAIDTAGVRLSGLNFFAGQLPGPTGRPQPPRPRRRIPRQHRPRRTDRRAHRGHRLQRSLRPSPGRCRPRRPGPHRPREHARRRRGRLTCRRDRAHRTHQRRRRLPAQDRRRRARLRRTGPQGRAQNVAFLADFFHLAVNGDDVAQVVRDHAAEFGHIQIADVPGRGEPGSGELPLELLLLDSQAHGYNGLVGLEYKPTVPSAESFGWLS